MATAPGRRRQRIAHKGSAPRRPMGAARTPRRCSEGGARAHPRQGSAPASGVSPLLSWRFVVVTKWPEPEPSPVCDHSSTL
eukprot:12434337-Alexandrium_andersonii.AAC.1